MGKKRILVVDDTVMVLKAVARVLTHRGYEVLKAESVDEAEEILAKETVDCVITDFSMPVRNGHDMARLIKSRWPELPVFIYTSDTEVDQDVSDGVFDKPDEFDQMLEAIRERLKV